MKSALRPAIIDDQSAWYLAADGTLSLDVSEIASPPRPTRSTETISPPVLLVPWTRRIAQGSNASADHVPDGGTLAAVSQLGGDLRQAEVTVDGC